MRDPPCKLNIELDSLLLNIYNNNPYTLYRRNEIIRLRSINPSVNFNVLLNKMWNNEPHEIKEFYKILAVEGNRRFKLRYQQLAIEFYSYQPHPLPYYKLPLCQLQLQLQIYQPQLQLYPQPQNEQPQQILLFYNFY
ncbi:hypothetical protein RclHR1_01870011 [Rhizophagus clarus]|uniref:HMG box domain-containing protein n=1 Tax=Rhizophagus clarus TaxID=94130 RepID=A0A2Z6RFY8_9GLOM|nr:hypothetical protein RclHR1_01870011 [Rhizophagus clarus]GES83816.1 hypothetical protein GLOIN_2v1882604 [Rhizophagus clarus]